MIKKFIKSFLFLVWILMFGLALYFFFSQDIPLTDYPKLIREYLGTIGFWGPIIYVLIYAIRPLVFFPATLLTTVSGLVFGPWLGILYTIVGENISANVSFLVGRYFGGDFVKRMTQKGKALQRFDCKFKGNGFISVLVMRLIFLPFDLVGYASGACDIRQRDFALGTFIGILPGLTTFVLLGSSFTDPRNLILAGIFFVLGILISKYLKKKDIMGQKKTNKAQKHKNRIS